MAVASVMSVELWGAVLHLGVFFVARTFTIQNNMTRPILTLKKKPTPTWPQENALILLRFYQELCISCARPVQQRGFALCNSCWKRAPRKFKAWIGVVEKTCKPTALVAWAKPSPRWFGEIRRVDRALKREAPAGAGA